MTTHFSSQDEQSPNATRAVEGVFQAGGPAQQSVHPSIILPEQPEQEEEETLYFEEEQADLIGAPFATPFQLSHAMPALSAHAQPSGPITPGPAEAVKKTRRLPRLSLTMVAVIVCVVVIVGMLVMNALVQTAPPKGNGSSQMAQQHPGTLPQPTKTQGMQEKQGNTPQATANPSPTSAPLLTPGANGQGQTTQPSADWIPQSLPDGWVNAGLQTGDGIQALRTAVAFNDREMSLDYRSVGTRDHHAGTFTAATFLMTEAAKQRFQYNDVRAINNTLFDTVANQKRIRLVVNPQPKLVKFAQTGQQQFAWVDVAFQLWQSQIDPTNQGQRVEGKELDPASNQPRIHHMMVLLLLVFPQEAGNNPAMGGTGWLVSTYALDPANGALPDILQPA